VLLFENGGEKTNGCAKCETLNDAPAEVGFCGCERRRGILQIFFSDNLATSSRHGVKAEKSQCKIVLDGAFVQNWHRFPLTKKGQIPELP